jgi:hypothetical protein
MVNLAIGEGDLHPGQRATGFVYFPRSILSARRLSLTWLVHDSGGRALGVVRAHFRVRRGGYEGWEVLTEGGLELPEGIVTPIPLQRPGDPIVPP